MGHSFPASLLAVLALVACSTSSPPAVDAPTTAGQAPTPPPTAAATPTPTRQPSAAPSVPETAHPASIASIIDAAYDGSGLRRESTLARRDAYTSYAVTYRGSGLRISGILNIPRGPGPFPVVITAHGYIDVTTYYSGQGLRRENDYLPRRGYAVLHVDYRNHSGSDDDPRNGDRLRLGYAEDVINAALAIQSSGMSELDGDRIAILGRSMGGGVAMQALVAQPGLFDAAIIYASVSSDAGDNFNRWQRESRDGRRLMREYGAPEDSPDFWRAASSYAYFNRISEPILMLHGTQDQTCPIDWARQTLRRMTAAGVDVTLVEYPGEDHTFWDRWQDSIDRSVDFLDAQLT